MSIRRNRVCACLAASAAMIAMPFAATPARAQATPDTLISVCSGVSLPPSVVTGIIDPVVTGIYNPIETKLIREAKKAGVQTLGGLEMLIAQGAEQFRIWTGREAPLEAMTAAVKKKLNL